LEILFFILVNPSFSLFLLFSSSLKMDSLPNNIYFAENFAQDIQQLGSLYFIRFPLRTYQKEGLAWLLSLHHTNVNGILADEMVRDFQYFFLSI